jgi:hypothetical protein
MRIWSTTLAATLVASHVYAQPAATAAQQSAQQPFTAGMPLKLSANAKVFGSFRFAESLSYDAERDLYIAVNAGMPQDVVPNDGYISLINPDGSVHTLKWIGITRNGLTLNHPLGSDVANGRLYVADINTIRWFDLKTGEPQGSVDVPDATRFNDIEVAGDGTIYATQTGDQNSQTWRVYRVTPQGQSSVLVSGAPLRQPNGVALDSQGNIVVVNVGTNDVLTFSPAGQLLNTEQAVDAGNDGLVVLPDGTKYVSSVRQGTVSRIRPGQKAEIVASGIPSAASMTYDPKRNRLVIPMNDWNAIAIVELNAPTGGR